MPIRKPTRAEMAAEWRAKTRAHREERRKEAARLMPVLTGNPEAIFGRIVQPGEHPSSTAPMEGREDVASVEESRGFARPWRGE